MLDHFKRDISKKQASKLHELAVELQTKLFKKYEYTIGNEIGDGGGREINPIYGIPKGTWVPSSWFYGGYDINNLFEIDHNGNDNIHPLLTEIRNNDIEFMVSQFVEENDLDKDTDINTIPRRYREAFREFEDNYNKMVFSFGCILGFKEVDKEVKMFAEVYVNSDEGYYREKYNKIMGEIQLSLDAFMKGDTDKIVAILFHKVDTKENS